MIIFKKTFITFFLLLFIKLKCQLIITSNDIESEQKRISRIFTKIFLEKTRTLLYQKQLSFSEGSEETNYTITKVRIINFSVVNNKYVPYFIHENNVLVYFPNKIKFVINVEYYDNDNPDEIKNNNFGVLPYNCIFKNLDTNNVFSSSFSAVFEDPKSIIDESKSDKIFESLVDSLKYDFWYSNEKEIKETVKKSMISGINDYYKNKEPIVFYTINNNRNIIHLNTFVKLCNIKNLTNTYQCYYMGNLNNYSKQYLDEVNLENEEFYKDDGNYKVFFDNELINNIIEETFSYPFNYTLKTNHSITQFFKDQIKNEIKNMDNFTFELNILDIETRNEENKLITNFKLINKVFNHQTSEPIETTSNITITFNTKINLTGFNFCYNSLVYKINETKNDLFKLEKKDDLIEILSDLLSKRISNEEKCLFKDEGIDLIDLMKLIKKCEFIKEGLMCVGEAMINENE